MHLLSSLPAWTGLFLLIAVVAPLMGSLLLAALSQLSEVAVARLSLWATVISTLAALTGIGCWLVSGAGPFLTQNLDLASFGHYHLDLSLRLDGIAAVFLLLVQFMSGTVIRFSRVY